jgi:hypothetical protein
MTGSEGKWLFVVSAIMALAVAALVYFLFGVHAPEAQQTSAASGSQASTGPGAPRVRVAPLPEPAADETELCGYGRVKESDFDDIRAKAAAAADRTLRGLRVRLAASADPRAAALGFYLQGSKDALVKLASGSRDPQVYALAFLSCGYARDGACALLSVEQWANIEPDNAVPWLLVAAAASDSAARDEAVFRAAAADRFDARFPDFLGLLRSPDVRSQPPQTRAAIGEDLVGLEVTLPGLPYQPFYRFCNFPSAAEGSHMGACNNLAKLLLERDRTMLGFAVGAKLAQTAGWPPDAVKKLGEQKMEFQAAFTAAVSEQSAKARSNCEELAAFDRWAADYSSLGDRGVAIKFIEEVGPMAGGLKRRQ